MQNAKEFQPKDEKLDLKIRVDSVTWFGAAAETALVATREFAKVSAGMKPDEVAEHYREMMSSVSRNVWAKLRKENGALPETFDAPPPPPQKKRVGEMNPEEYAAWKKENRIN